MKFRVRLCYILYEGTSFCAYAQLVLLLPTSQRCWENDQRRGRTAAGGAGFGRTSRMMVVYEHKAGLLYEIVPEHQTPD